MKIIVISDIHGNQYALKNFIKEMKYECPDRIYFLGDIFGYYYGQYDCLKILLNTRNVYCIKGNHDQYFLNSLSNKNLLLHLIKKFGHSYAYNLDLPLSFINAIQDFPQYRCLNVDSIKIAFCHGSLDNYLEGRIYPDTKIDCRFFDLYNKYDVVFLGHTHHKMVRRVGKTLLCNPGSLGQQRDGLGCSYVVFDTVSRKLEFRIIDFNRSLLSNEVDLNDKNLSFLKEVIYRDGSYKKNE